MNEDDSIPGRQAQREAEHWFARRLAPDFSEHQRFEFWLREHPDNPLAWAGVRQCWNELGQVLRDERFDAMTAEALSPRDGGRQAGRPRAATHPYPRRMSRFTWPMRLLGMAAVLLLAVLVLPFDKVLYVPAVEYATAASEQALELPDGSRVQLDYHSHIRVTQNGRERYVQLLEGRALFDVAHDRKRPFTVQIGSTRVVATGTRFQVDRNGADISVTLLSGEVLVNTGLDGESIRLKPGTQLSSQGSTRAWHQSSIDTDAEVAWTRGFFQFENTPLVDAIRQVNRYSEKPIRLGDARLGELRVSGNFKRGDGARFATALPHVLPVVIRVESDHIVVASP